MSVELVCPTCATPMQYPGADNPGVIDCVTCTEKLVWADEALTYVDEIPHDEYLGG